MSEKRTKVKIRKDDMVQVIAGKNLGRRGKVLQVLPADGRVLIEKVNFVKKHQKARKQGQQSQILSIEAPLHLSNVMLVCPNCSAPARVGRTKLADGVSVRMCKKCNEIIDK